jgi:hypothetical protein
VSWEDPTLPTRMMVETLRPRLHWLHRYEDRPGAEIGSSCGFGCCCWSRGLGIGSGFDRGFGSDGDFGCGFWALESHSRNSCAVFLLQLVVEALPSRSIGWWQV